MLKSKGKTAEREEDAAKLAGETEEDEFWLQRWSLREEWLRSMCLVKEEMV